MASTDSTRKPTIRDVAAVAGVSHGTVSRVINGGHWVSPEARAAVEEAIRTTGYTTNHAARSLATGRAGSLAFLLTEPQHLLFSDPTFALLLRGATEALAERSMTLVLLIAGTAEEQSTVENYVRAGHVDGVLLVSSHESDSLLASLVAAGVPTVCTGIPLGDAASAPNVSVDEIGSARMMTRYLLDKGHERIALITGPNDTPGGRFRLVGFREELGDRFDPDLVEQGSYERATGDAAMTRLLERAPDIDAVFAASDVMAVGAIDALRRAGRRVPEDVAVAGFDDSGLAETFQPPLTTVRQPWSQISSTMVDMVLDVIAGTPRESVMLPTDLVVRESA
ncbi:MAG: LacI family transcriptional regulator [Microbacterium sp. SCN 70-200]|uniref:LacI family DNA-binding transcriptional regulator n=1 Tax=unclassified Microbacterium TaxID=2609290 RepID=UPI00086D58B6|nr:MULTISPECIES: LacI family DNA-binding transcriptional regulator [unclassified Microbacterium]MBN9213429.1 LacI family DNA-binding transcriptional regulator [Microbacterium sp.]ODT40469.1 MAG: LacI family transcriptional regulator [Microbacterium sp. SCN 70-200]OJV85062.1 MAG: LacI family transcriptional regulator [Microbacterium sp. 70-16]